MLDKDVKKYIDKSVLCWLATVDQDNYPNVSPKEMFTYQDDTTILVANIASPISVSNVRVNPKVCISFIDIFVQKGYKLKGLATIIDKEDPSFGSKAKRLTDLFSDKFAIQSILEIKIIEVTKIIAPSYRFYPETTEESQIANAMKTYHIEPHCSN
jgi:uncharacterized protein